MKDLRRILLVLFFVVITIIARSMTIQSTPLVFKIVILIVTPIILIYIALKYSNPGKAKKYRIISFSTAGLWFYICIIMTYIDENYHYFYMKHSNIFKLIEIGSLFIAFIVAGVCLQKIKSEESKYI